MLPLPDRAELRRRVPRLIVGLVSFGWGIALMVTADLGLSPWAVFHQGIETKTGIPIGTVGIITGLIVLSLWIPLKERFGIGTVTNVILVGIVVDLTIWALPGFTNLGLRWTGLLAGIFLVGLATGLYIGVGLGPGPRDGLMTGLARRGYPVGVVRVGIEVTVLVVGFILGGTVGVGTVLFSLGIGGLVHVLLPRLRMDPVPAP